MKFRQKYIYEEAVLMLESSPAAEKDIILLSDGEILMEDEETTA